MTSNRILWIDWLKIIGMFLIVYGHFYPSHLAAFLYSFSVPLFFFVSGFLNAKKKRGFKEEIVHSIRILLIPMLFVTLINWALDYGNTLLVKPWKETTLIPFYATLKGEHSPLLHGLWFVYDLFFIRLLTKALSERFYKYLLLLAFIMMTIIYYKGLHAAAPFINIWAGVFYYMLGIYAKREQVQRYLERLLLMPKKYLVPLSVLLFLLQYVMSANNGYYLMFNATFGTHYFLTLLLSLTGILLSITCVALFQQVNPRWLNAINTGAIWIIGLHFRFID